jgi:undecaprenyl-diphosphatase
MLWVALILGLLEGLTEFLPISSTGHLIVASDLLGFHGRRAELFEVFIQLGAILAVVWEYRHRLFAVAGGVAREPRARGFALRLAAAFLPSAILGLLAYDAITRRLFNPTSVGVALVAGALAIFVVEALPLAVRTHEAEAIGWRQALAVGVAQCLALWPGFSRSAATILGGLGAGLDRRAATEFSFFLAIPTMVGATSYSLWKRHDALVAGDLLWLAVAFAVSFVVAWATIRWLLRWVSSHTFIPFAWYRLALGLALLIWL